MSPDTQTQLVAVAVAALCGWAIPAVVDLVTKSHLHNSVKAFAAAVLSAVAGAVSTVQLAAGERWSTYVLAIGAAFASTMSAHATGYSAAVQRVTAGFGIGPANPKPADPVATEPS